ncbi:MAG: transporter associated domain-containing protein, partial [Methylophaga sp.]
VEDFNEFFEVDWSDDDFDTVGGHVVNQFGHLPGRGEQITIAHFEFTILRADNRRVHLMRMVVLPEAPESETEIE